MLDELAERDGRPHRPGGDESPQDGLAEAGVGPPGKELEELCIGKNRGERVE